MTPTPANRCRVLTPPGAGAIGVIRAEGPDVKTIVRSLLRPPHRHAQGETAARANGAESPPQLRFPEGDRVAYALLEADGETLDDVIVSQAPTTNLPVIDICTHGGIRVMERIVEALESRGVRLATEKGAGEPLWQTKNLIEQEADDALARAKTARAVRFIARHRADLPARIRAIAEQCVVDSDEARVALEALMEGYECATRVIAGATVVLIGPPNSGKSTLFNQLIGRQAALVSPMAGTTRDWVSAEIELDGVPVTLVDTAGQRTAAGNLEKLAIAMGRDTARHADVLAVVLDGSQALPDQIRTLTVPQHAKPALLFISNRRDGEAWEAADLFKTIGRPVAHFCRVAAKSGEGIEDLIRQLLRVLGFVKDLETLSLFSIRQFKLVEAILSDSSKHGPEMRRVILEQLLQADTVPGQMLPR